MTIRPAPIRVGVAGLGYWGPNLVRVLHELDDVEVVALCDPDSAALRTLMRRYPALRGFATFGELLEDDIDAVAIATPVPTHYELALSALEHGKHVFVEKPMALSVEEAQTLIRVADDEGLTLMPGHTFLYSPPVVEVRGLIESGDLGDIYFISTSRVNLGLHQPDGSVIWDLGPHDLSILEYWLGQAPASVSAMTRCCVMPDVPDVAFVNLRYASGTVAHMELAWLAPSKLRRTAVVGSRKMVVYDDTSNEPVRVFDSGVDLPTPADFGQYRLSYRTGDIVSPAIAPVEPLSFELADFRAAIGTGREPRSSAGLGLSVIRTIEAIEESLAGTHAGATVQVA